ncbi:MAG TPA: RNA polymerase sigma factor, partial [Leucothrix sp.]|nr:RNA polymerase sigma factor [Leucothrix sp.]
AWLFTMQHNIFVNQLKSKARKPELVSSTEMLTDIIEPNQPNVIMRDIHYCMQRLPENQREVLLLVTVEGFSYKEVGEIVGIPLGTVMSRLSRARKTLQQLMNGEVKSVLREVK